MLINICKNDPAKTKILLSIFMVLLTPLYFLALLTLEIADCIWFQIKKNEK